MENKEKIMVLRVLGVVLLVLSFLVFIHKVFKLELNINPVFALYNPLIGISLSVATEDRIAKIFFILAPLLLFVNNATGG